MRSPEIVLSAGQINLAAPAAEAQSSSSRGASRTRHAHDRRWLAALLLLATTLLFAGEAFAQRAFTPRYQNLAVNGDIELIGNMNMHCDPAQGSALCQGARAGGDVDNNNVWMIHVDVDTDASTFNSSTATLNLPAGAEVLYAALYWSGQSDDVTARRTVKFKPPGQAAYVDLVSMQTDAIPFASALTPLRTSKRGRVRRAGPPVAAGPWRSLTAPPRKCSATSISSTASLRPATAASTRSI
jgi:hypothetical protein